MRPNREKGDTNTSMIPTFIKNIKGLKLFDRCLLSQIHYLSAQRGYCFAGNEYFVDFFEVSLGTVKRSLKKMEDLGLISRVTTWNRRYIYLSCLPAEDKQEKKEEKVEEKTQEKRDKKPIRYSREGFRFLQKLNQPPTQYHQASKELRLSDNEQLEADVVAHKFFERWHRKMSGDG